MQTALICISVFISILLIIVVLIQKSKGGGLASNFAGSNQIMGVRRTNNFIEKTTWTLASVICFLALLSGILMRGGVADRQPLVKDVNPVDQFMNTYDTPEQDAAVTVVDENVAADAEGDVAVEETVAATEEQ